MSNAFVNFLPYIVGVGGWIGIVVSIRYYMNGERLSWSKIEEIIALPFICAFLGGVIASTLYIGAISAFVTTRYIISSMRHPGTLLFVLLLMWIYIGIEFGILTPLRNAYRTEAETAAAELAADAEEDNAEEEEDNAEEEEDDEDNAEEEEDEDNAEEEEEEDEDNAKEEEEDEDNAEAAKDEMPLPKSPPAEVDVDNIAMNLPRQETDID